MKAIPTALFVGPMKSGTSWIDDYLRYRADICLPEKVKETFFFDRHYDRGIDWYKSFFYGYDRNSHRLVAEVAPSLFHVDESIIRTIRADLGDVPIIVTLRDPIKRSWSHYLHMRRGYTNKPFQEAIGEFPEILEASFYQDRLSFWRSHFSKVIVVYQELLTNDERAFMSMIDDHFGLPNIDTEAFQSKNKNQASEPRFFIVSRLGRHLSRTMRASGLYSVVNVAKQFGLKNLFYGSAKKSNHTKLEIGEADAAFLRKKLESELKTYKQMSGNFVREWTTRS